MICETNGSWNVGCGFQDKPLMDDDEIDVNSTELDDVKVLYVKPKHHHEHDDNDSYIFSYK